MLRAAGNRQEALDAINQALSLNPHEPNAWLVKAQLLADADQHADAYQAFQRTLAAAHQANIQSKRRISTLIPPFA